MTVKSHDLAHIRSVVLAGHAGAGKTTLAEQVLFRAGAIPRLGRVDDGTAHLDYEPEEQKRHQSLSLAVGTFEHGEHEITVVDTPGYPDFTAEMIQGFHAADAALFVMDASGGVEAGLEAAVAIGRATNTAACFVLNKCDRENADPGAALDALRDGLRDEDRAAPPGDRGRRHVQRLRRPRPSQGVEVRGRQGGRDPRPRRARRRGRPAPRPAARGGGRGRRRRVREVPRRGGGQRRGARRVPPQGRPRVDPRARARRLRGQGHRPVRAARRDRPLPALARGGGPVRRDRQGGQGRRGPGDRQPAAGPGVQDRGGPVRRAADLPARAVRDAQEPGDGVQRDRGRGRAHRPAAVPPRQGAGARAPSCGRARSARSPSSA